MRYLIDSRSRLFPFFFDAAIIPANPIPAAFAAVRASRMAQAVRDNARPLLIDS